MNISKETQTKVINYLQARPSLVKAMASVVSFLARVAAPFYFIYSLFLKKHPMQRLILDNDLKDSIKAKLEEYDLLQNQVADSHGFLGSEKCDSLLFSCLTYGAYKSKQRTFDILSARAEDGSWQRRPTERPCYPCESASTISRDMLLGLMFYIWRSGRIDYAEDLYAYGVKNKWIMGEGDPSRLYFAPGLQATLAEIIYRLGGKNHWWVRKLPQMWPKGLTGYQANLDAIHILLRSELLGRVVDSSMLAEINDISESDPKNVFFAFLKKIYTGENLDGPTPLFRTFWWPMSRLPTAMDRDTEWLFQETDTSGNADSDEVFSGGDFTFLASLYLDYSEE